jgi:site-specific recombinase XerD
MVRLLGRYSQAYASNQYRALQQFFKWLAEEDESPDPMARLHPPKVTDPLIPAFTSGELSALERACAGRTFAQRRDTAIIAVFRATGIRLAELAAIRYDLEDAHRSDIDLWQREITVCGKGGKTRIVRFGHQAARSLDRYLRLRARHAQARPQLWLGTSNRGPLTASGIYQIIAWRDARPACTFSSTTASWRPALASPAATRPQSTQPRQAPYRAHGRSGRFRTSLAATAACA